MRESTGTKAVRVSLLKEVQPLTPELGGVVIKAGLPAVGEVGVPVRPVLDIGKRFEELPSIPWIPLLKLVPGPPVVPSFLDLLFPWASLVNPRVPDTSGFDRLGGQGHNGG